MKKKIRELFPELTAAVLLTVLSAYLRRCMDILDLVAACAVYGNGGNAGHRKAFWWF